MNDDQFDKVATFFLYAYSILGVIGFSVFTFMFIKEFIK